MKTKRFLSFILALIACFSLCSCGNQEEKKEIGNTKKEETELNRQVNMLCVYIDGFNPYTAQSDINRQLSKLIFDPLVKVDNNFNPVNCLAKETKLEGNICTITLKDAYFTDGTKLTSQDVVHSFNLARYSATAYSSKLYEVAEISATDALTVVFKLTRQDKYFLNLIDFPILKAGSETIVDEDAVLQPPIGCGRYKLSDGNQKLVINENYHGKIGEIKEINLINSPDKDSVSHYVEIGATSLYYVASSDGEIVRMSGKKKEVNLNSLIFLGINSYYPALDNKEIRYAISSALDRDAVSKDAFYNNTIAAKGFFTPVFEDAKALQSLSTKSNLEITVENLNKIGYNRQDSDGYYINSGGYRASFTLLVNGDNRTKVLAANLIKNQLKTAGIQITVVEKSYGAYLAALQSGSFQLYLGETEILPNMDFSQLVIPGGSAAYGVKPYPIAENVENPDESQIEGSMTTADIINGFYQGKNSLSDVAGFLITEMPQIPICYRKGLLFYSDKFDGEVEASQSDIYFSIESYTYKK